MMSEEWPIAAPLADPPVDPVRPAGGDRMAAVRVDFFLDPAMRLNEQERALMRSMLEDLIASIADAIAAFLPTGLDAIGDGDHDQLIARLWRSGLLDRARLIGLLLRHADERRLGVALHRRSGRAKASLIQRLAADNDDSVAAAAMALAVARGRRRDRFGQERLLFDDLPAEEACALVPAVGAALRHALPPQVAIDRDIAAAGQRLLGQHDESQRLEAVVEKLVRVLDAVGRLDDRIVEQMTEEGDVTMLSAVLARRAGVGETMAWRRLCSAGEGRLAELARVAGVGRAETAGLLIALGHTAGVSDPAGELKLFDEMDAAAIDAFQQEWRLPAAYRAARERLSG